MKEKNVDHTRFYVLFFHFLNFSLILDHFSSDYSESESSGIEMGQI